MLAALSRRQTLLSTSSRRLVSIRADATKMATFTKTILTAGDGPTPKKNQKVTVSADLYLADASGGKGTGIWSTHKPTGFLFPATRGPEPFEYEAGVGGVVRGWEDGVASMQLGESAMLQLPWQYACECPTFACEPLKCSDGACTTESCIVLFKNGNA